MDRLWSPWRSQHLESFDVNGDGEQTVFEAIAASDQDEEHLIVWRGLHVFVLMNLYPYTNGHLLIVPYRPVADYEALTAEERHEMTDALDRCIRWLRRALRPDGFNVGMNLGQAGGAGVPDHLHMHVVPRWAGDTNFMTSLADVRVVPEALRATYQKIRGAAHDEGSSPAT